MTGLSDYEALRNKNVQEREALFSTLFKELRDLSEPVRKSLQQKSTPKPSSPGKSQSSTVVSSKRRRSVRIRRSTRLKRNHDDDYVYEEDESDDSDDDFEWESDDETNCDPKNRLSVCFPCQFKFRVNVVTSDIIDVWEGIDDEELTEEEEDEEKKVPQRRSFGRRATEVPVIVLSPDEVTEQDIKNVAQKSGGKKYDSERGTCCHQCRQKTVDTKTMCRSGSCVGVRGQFCGPCLKNRYGESAEKALKDPNWSCPPCRGLCNCSICRTREGKKPTGILVPFVKSEGYTSVKEYLQFEED